MDYRYRVPRPPLDAFITLIWVYQNGSPAHALERILPTGAAQLIVNLKEDQTRFYDPGVATPLCRDIGFRVGRRAIPVPGHRYVGTGVCGRCGVQTGRHRSLYANAGA